jgi:hypothetical protein
MVMDLVCKGENGIKLSPTLDDKDFVHDVWTVDREVAFGSSGS